MSEFSRILGQKGEVELTDAELAAIYGGDNAASSEASNTSTNTLTVNVITSSGHGGQGGHGGRGGLYGPGLYPYASYGLLPYVVEPVTVAQPVVGQQVEEVLVPVTFVR